MESRDGLARLAARSKRREREGRRQRTWREEGGARGEGAARREGRCRVVVGEERRGTRASAASKSEKLVACLRARARPEGKEKPRREDGGER